MGEVFCFTALAWMNTHSYSHTHTQIAVSEFHNIPDPVCFCVECMCKIKPIKGLCVGLEI